MGFHFWGSRRERELKRELAQHLRQAADERVERGETPEDARRAARREFGNENVVRETTRDMWAWRWLEDTLQDLRYGSRTLRKNPGFTAIAIFTLALGIGPNTAMFSVLNAVLLRPLPYYQQDRLMVMQEQTGEHGSESVSYPDYQDWRTQQDVFERMALYRSQSLNLTGMGNPEHLKAAVASSELFPMLGLNAIVGQTFTAEDDLPSSAAKVLLSYGFWQRRFGGNRDVVGQAITMNDRVYTIAGVIGDVQSVPRNTDLWTNFGLQAAWPALALRFNHMGFSAIGRLKKGVSEQQSRAEMSAIAARLSKQYPATNLGMGVLLTPMLETMVGNYRQELILLAGAVGFVLLIACANLANLLYARGANREQELAMRSALGAGRGRLIRQLLTESILLAMMGGLVGVLLAFVSRGAIVAMSPANAARFPDTRVDGAVIAFAFGVSLLTGILFGLSPAWKLARTNLRDVMQEGGRGSSDVFGRARLRQSLITAEVALTLVLLASASLLIQSLKRTESVKLGFDPNRLLMLDIDLAGKRYAKKAQVNEFYDQLLEGIRALPGVVGATLDSAAPLDTNWQANFEVEGHAPFAPGQAPSAEISVVDTDYFRVMHIPIMSGRSFGREEASGPPTIVVDEAFARQIWPGENAVGKRLIFWRGSPFMSTTTVVGVVPTVRLYGYTEQPHFLQVYFPQAQIGESGPTVMVRAAGDPSTLTQPIRSLVHEIDPTQAVYAVRTLEQDLKDSVSSARLMVSLLSIFAGLALVMASAGLYGVVSYSVSRRRREIGIRMALGAQSKQVMWMIVAQGLRPAVIGIVIGVVGAIASGKLLQSLLYETPARDPVTLAGVSVLLALLVLAASYIPGRRAMRVDPIIALRHE
jgi:putative ABC transport system permease protein